jgi:hypothetical protein
MAGLLGSLNPLIIYVKSRSHQFAPFLRPPATSLTRNENTVSVTWPYNGHPVLLEELRQVAATRPPTIQTSGLLPDRLTASTARLTEPPDADPHVLMVSAPGEDG